MELGFFLGLLGTLEDVPINRLSRDPTARACSQTGVAPMLHPLVAPLLGPVMRESSRVPGRHHGGQPWEAHFRLAPSLEATPSAEGTPQAEVAVHTVHTVRDTVPTYLKIPILHLLKRANTP